MIITVLVVNSLIGLVCLYVAWTLWQLKTSLGQVADTLASVEKVIYDVLHPAPGFIYQGQTGIRQLRQSYGQLTPQVQRVRQVLGLLGLGRSVWRSRSPLARMEQRTGRRGRS